MRTRTGTGCRGSSRWVLLWACLELAGDAACERTSDHVAAFPVALPVELLPGCSPRPAALKLLFQGTLRNGPEKKSSVLWRHYVGRSWRALCVSTPLSFEGVGWLEQDELGNILLSMRLENLTAFEQRSIGFYLQLDDVPETELPYTALEAEPARWVRWDHPSLSRYLEVWRSLPVETRAPQVVRWLFDTVQAQGYRRQPQPPHVTLGRRSGDCTDLSILAVSMLRGAGVPARLVSGYTCMEGCGRMLPHTWVVYRDRNTWRGLDLTRPEQHQALEKNIGLATWHETHSAIGESALFQFMPTDEHLRFDYTVQQIGGDR